VQPVGIAAEIAEPRGVLRAHHGYMAKLERRRKAPVEIEDAFPGQRIADGLELGFDVAQRVRGIDVLDDCSQAVGGAELGGELEQHLQARHEMCAGVLLELLLDEVRPAGPDETLQSCQKTPCLVVLHQLDCQMAAIDGSKLADLRPHPLGFGHLEGDRLADLG